MGAGIGDRIGRPEGAMALTPDQRRVLTAVPGVRDPFAARAWTIAERAGMGIVTAPPVLRALKAMGHVRSHARLHGSGGDERWSRTAAGDQALRGAAATEPAPEGEGEE